MSVAVRWRPASDQGKRFSGGTSSQLEKVISAIGSTVTESDVDKLQAMHIATGEDFYDEIADTVEQVGAIVIWGEY